MNLHTQKTSDAREENAIFFCTLHTEEGILLYNSAIPAREDLCISAWTINAIYDMRNKTGKENKKNFSGVHAHFTCREAFSNEAAQKYHVIVQVVRIIKMYFVLPSRHHTKRNGWNE